jgi:8-oxo-dGTP diphosphatase
MSAPEQVVTAVLVRQHRVLLVHRTPEREHHPDRWDLPGGHVEEGETAVAALVRELREELGIDAEVPDGVLGRIVEPGVENAVRVVRRWVGDAALPDEVEHDGLVWLTLDEARSFLPDRTDLLELLARAAIRDPAG